MAQVLSGGDRNWHPGTPKTRGKSALDPGVATVKSTGHRTSDQARSTENARTFTQTSSTKRCRRKQAETRSSNLSPPLVEDRQICWAGFRHAVAGVRYVSGCPPHVDVAMAEPPLAPRARPRLNLNCLAQRQQPGFEVAWPQAALTPA